VNDDIKTMAETMRRTGGVPGTWTLQVSLSVPVTLSLSGADAQHMTSEALTELVAKQLSSESSRTLASCIDEVVITDRPTPSLPDLSTVRVEPETIAFAAIGAARYRDSLRREQAALLTEEGGEVGFIGRITASPALAYAEWLFHRWSDEFPAVFAYEVAEPLGEALAKLYAPSPVVTLAEECRIAQEIFDAAIGRTAKTVHHPVTASVADDRAGRVFRAARFFRELLDSVETLSGIAEEYGSDVLATLMYLQSEIVKGDGGIEVSHDSPVIKLVGALPSAHEWQEYIEVGS